MLKGTIIANLIHGPFNGCKNQQAKQEIVTKLVEQGTPEWHKDKVEGIAFDRGVEIEDLAELDVAQLMSMWINARTNEARGTFVAFLVDEPAMF